MAKFLIKLKGKTFGMDHLNYNLQEAEQRHAKTGNRSFRP